MKKIIKFLGIILCLFLMVSTVNALTLEQVREELLEEDIVFSNTRSTSYETSLYFELSDRISEIDDDASISTKGCTYTTCSFDIIRGNERLEVNNIPIKKYGIVFANDDVILNHVGDTLTLNYQLLDENYHEVEAKSSYVRLSGEEDDNVVFNGNKITFNAPGYYEIFLMIEDTYGETYYGYLTVLTDAQSLIDTTLNSMNSFKSDRSTISGNVKTEEALNHNLLKQILPRYDYSVYNTDTKEVVGEDSKYNVNFTLRIRENVLTFTKNNLLVQEVGLALLENLYSVELNLKNNKTYQVQFKKYSDTANWISSNPQVATITNNGLITAVGGGATLITITTPDGKPQYFTVLVEDNGEKKAYLTNILNNVVGSNHELYVPAVSDAGEILEDEIRFAFNEKLGQATNDGGVSPSIVEMSEDYRTVKVRLGYEITLLQTEEEYHGTTYCKTWEYDYGFDCATDVVTINLTYEDDKQGYNNNLKAIANTLANQFNAEKVYISDANKSLSDYVANPEQGYAEKVYENAHLNESIQNNDQFGILVALYMGGYDYFPASMKDLNAVLARDGIIYRLVSEKLKIKQILTVPRNEGEGKEAAITRTVRNIVGNQPKIEVKLDEYYEGEGEAYIIEIDKIGESKLSSAMIVEFTNQEGGTAINALNIIGIVAPVEGEHPTTDNIQITTPGVTLKDVVWVEDKINGRELTKEDVFTKENDAKYMLRFTFDLENGYEINGEPKLNANVRPAQDDWNGCQGEEPCTNDLDFRLYYGVKSLEPVGITAIPDINISNDNNSALVLNIAYDVNATYLEVYRSTSEKGTYKRIATINEGYYRDTNLTYGTLYFYKVKACNNVNCSALSKPKSGKIVPNKVNGLKALEVSTTQVKLGWEKFDNVTGYDVARSTKINGTYTVITTKNVDTVTTTGLNGNTAYYYKIRAYQTIGKSKVAGDYSDPIEVKTAPIAPKISIVGGEYNSLKLRVTGVTGATSYEIYRSTAKSGEFTKVGTLESAGEFVDNNVETGKTYYYKTKACNANCGVFSALASKVPVLSIPTFTASVNNNKKVAINITEVFGADGYEISRSLYKNKKFEVVANTEELTYEVEASLNTTYYYRVRAYRIVDEKKAYGSYSGLKTVKVTLGTPTITLTKENLNDVTINITAVTGAAGYEIVKSTNKSKKFSVTGTVTELTFSEKGNLNATYYYKVRAYILVGGKKQYGGYSAIKSTKSNLATPSFSFERAGVTTANIKINSVTYAEGYEIYRSLYKNKKFTQIADVTDLTYLDTLALNTTYYYKIRAYVLVNSKKEYSGYSSVKSNKLILDAPTFSFERASLTTANIKINFVTYAEGYEVYRSLYKNKKFSKIADVTDLTYLDTLTLNTTYYYQLRSYILVNDKKQYSGYSSVKSNKLTPEIPIFNTNRTALNKTTITIEKVQDAESYEISRSTSKTRGFKVLTITDELTYEDTISLGTTYYYRVRSIVTVNGKKYYSSYSALKTVKLSLDIPVVTLVEQEQQIEVTIGEVQFAEGYEIYRATSRNGKYTKLGDITELVSNIPAQANKVFYYKVKAFATLNGKKIYGGYSIIKSAKALDLAL